MKKGNFLFKAVLFIAGLALILLGVKGIILSFSGLETTAKITDVRVVEKREENGGYSIEITQSYSFVADGKDYTGTAKYSISNEQRSKNGGLYGQSMIQQKKGMTSLKVKYLSFWPSISEASDTTKSDIGSVLLRIGLMVLGLFLIIVAFKKKKKETVAPVSSMQEPNQPAEPASLEETKTNE